MNRTQRRREAAQNRASRRKDRRDMRCVAEAWEAEGCARCGYRADVASYMVIRQGSGMLAICESCRRPSDHLAYVGISAPDVSSGKLDDRQWFEANPSEEYRLRRAYPGETAELLARQAYLELKRQGEVSFEMPDREAGWVYVWQMRPGYRVRVPIFGAVDGEPSSAILAEARSMLENSKLELPHDHVERWIGDNAAAFGPLMDIMKASGRTDHDLRDLAIAQGEADRTTRKI